MESSCLLAAKRKKARKTAIINTLWYIFLAVISLIFLFPFIFMLNKSLMTGTEAGTLPIRFIPKDPVFEAYISVFAEGSQYPAQLLNTLKIVAFNMVAIPLSASIVAYGFAKLEFWGKNALFAIMISTMLLPSVVLQIPQYVMFSDFGWTDGPSSFLPLTVPNLLGGGAMNIFLVRQFMRSVPKDLDNAAKIDGAGAFRRYLTIMLPLCKPILIYIMVNTFNGYWSDFYGPLIYLRDPEQYTLAIGIFKDSIYNSSIKNVPVRMAAGVFMTFFPAVLFFVFQKQLIDGVMVGGVKG